MSNQPPLNPDALEAMSRVMNPPAWLMIDREPEDELVIMIKERELSIAEKLAAAYVAADKPEATRDQCIKLGSLIEKALRQCGISVTYAISGPSELGDVAWILLREYPTLAVAQPVVNSVEELDALPIGSIIIDKFGDAGLIDKEGTVEKYVQYAETAIMSIGYVGKHFLPARVLHRPEVNNG